MNETKKYLVIKAIAQGKKTKKRACVELNLSERQINRLLLAYQQKGFLWLILPKIPIN
ncbi:IS1202 transposase [Streptococcus pneumoniae]|nr:IS1202 transposase [Streptococcus pneumoniae]